MALPGSLRGRMCMDAADGDVDADGDPDLASAIESGRPALLIDLPLVCRVFDGELSGGNGNCKHDLHLRHRSGTDQSFAARRE